MLSLEQFLSGLFSNPVLAVTVILTLGVIFVNGWTDAPNAIATCVSTRAMGPRAAILMAAVFNFLGVLVMTMIARRGDDHLQHGGFRPRLPHQALVALCAALFSIVIWAVAAWYFGIPTSESHALIAGLSGAAIAMGGAAGINGEEWMNVIWGLVLSTMLGFGSGWLVAKITTFLCKGMERRKTTRFFRGAQIGGGAAMAFMHGAQDGQKFMGVFMLGIFLSNGNGDVESFQIPLWLMVLCSLVMAIGTSIGGYRIIKAVGMDMVKLETYQGFAADAAAAGCLLLASLTALPRQHHPHQNHRHHGRGRGQALSSVNWSVVKDMVMTWVLTFPGCGLIGF